MSLRHVLCLAIACAILLSGCNYTTSHGDVTLVRHCMYGTAQLVTPWLPLDEPGRTASWNVDDLPCPALPTTVHVPMWRHVPIRWSKATVRVELIAESGHVFFDRGTRLSPTSGSRMFVDRIDKGIDRIAVVELIPWADRSTLTQHATYQIRMTVVEPSDDAADRVRLYAIFGLDNTGQLVQRWP